MCPTNATKFSTPATVFSLVHNAMANIAMSMTMGPAQNLKCNHSIQFDLYHHGNILIIFPSQLFDTIFSLMDIAMLSGATKSPATGTSCIQSYSIQMTLGHIDNNYDQRSCRDPCTMRFRRN